MESPESFLPAPQAAKNAKSSKTRYKRPLTAKEIANLPDEEIDFSDIPELDERFWLTAQITDPHQKERITMRLDPEIIEYFKAQGKGYQTRINAVLKSFVEAQRSRS